MTPSIDAAASVGRADVVLVTLDTLRWDVASAAMQAGETPNLARFMGGWQRRHTPASFTYAAHTAFFAGFLPTPAEPGLHERLFALSFPGSETTGPRTALLDGADLPGGLRARGYRSVCIGGTGFFNTATPLGAALPSLFDVSFFDESLGVTDPRSTEHQVALALRYLDSLDDATRVFLFLNVSALHQPNCHYLPGATRDSAQTQRAALRYVDASLGPLFERLRARAPVLAVVTSDHGTAYGEDGYEGHRLGHPIVWTVPYAEALWDR